jgi:uncharacterized membrane protein YbhN (UPF0104 family)
MFAISTSSQFSTVLTPAGVGTFISVPFLKRCFQIPLAYGTFFAVVDRLYGLFFLCCFALIGFSGYVLNRDFFIILGIPVLLFIQWIFFRVLGVSDEVIHRFGVPEYGGKLLNTLGNDLIVQLSIVASKLIFFCILISQYLIVTRALGFSISILDAWMVISVSFIIGVASMIPMGLVSTDTSILALSSLVGVPASTGLIIIVLMRAVTIIPTALLGTVSGIWLSRKYYT